MNRSKVWIVALLAAALPAGSACVDLGSARTPAGSAEVEGSFASVHMYTHGMT